MERSFAGYAFERVGAIQPERDGSGEVRGVLPQSRYRNERNLELNRYGRGPFCRFRIARGENWRRSGAYILTSGNTVCYVGECQILESRWGPNGYGSISPRNCYTGGQETNCRINNLIFTETKTGGEFDLWFHSLAGGKQARRAVECQLVADLEPLWNR